MSRGRRDQGSTPRPKEMKYVRQGLHMPNTAGRKRQGRKLERDEKLAKPPFSRAEQYKELNKMLASHTAATFGILEKKTTTRQRKIKEFMDKPPKNPNEPPKTGKPGSFKDLPKPKEEEKKFRPV